MTSSAGDRSSLWVRVDDRLIIDAWQDGASRELTVDQVIRQGTHHLRVEFYEHVGEARVHVWWEKI